MNELPRVVIIGAGELGKAVGGLIGKKGVAVDFWDANPATVPGQKPLAEIVPLAGFVFFCVPSWAMREAVIGVVPYLSPQAAVFSFAKGIEKFSFQTMAEIVPTLLSPTQPFVVVGGPMLAEEIAVGKGAIGVFASHDAAALQGARELFASDDFYVETTDDVEGVALAGVLKNIYAVALGIADGLELSGNQKGWLTSRAIGEMRAIATALGADGGYDRGHCGRRRLHRNRIQRAFAQPRDGDRDRCHGQMRHPWRRVNTLPLLIDRLGEEKAAAFPLLMLVNTIGIECQPARPAFDAFFKDNGAAR